VPLRLRATEEVVIGKRIDSTTLAQAKKTAMTEIHPIDDIRSTARYRAAVAGNLVAEFLNRLSLDRAAPDREAAKNVLAQWNLLSAEEAVDQILPCCGSRAWARGMVARRPVADEDTLLAASNETWRNLAPSDWMEAFASHPRIGESRTSAPSPVQSPSAQSLTKSADWSAQEQRNVADSDAALKNALADANREYEQRFNRIFIVCASGKSASEILAILQRRMANDAETELQEAAEQQRQITQLRLRKWLEGMKQK